MMKNVKLFEIILAVMIISLTIASCGEQPTSAPEESSDFQLINLTDEAIACVECHATETHGIVDDWDGSRHADEAISCIDCHKVEADSPLALQGVEGHEDLTIAVSMLVLPSTCAECHEKEVADFDASGHHRAGLQVIAKDSMQTLIHVHEGQNHPELSGVSEETGCMQCHGTQIEVDETGHPTSETFPIAGIGNVYPNGEVGNCAVCHTRHSFDIAEARHPEACASCHLGPDHPDIEVYENSKHGQIFATEGEEWVWDSAPGEWEPGDYRAPTCATCHMSGIGELEVTHNVTDRLYWNLWAKVSKERTDPDVMGMYYGDGEAGREKMEMVCGECHSSTHTKAFFESGDGAVELYNEAYFAPAEEMRVELAELGLLKDNPWADEFQVIYYYLWHHEGRRARHGAMMAGPDWAHWEGFFILMQDLYRMQEIYAQRIETGEIEQ
jgi:formate-dependent nitrite reductase cytochrome c552 subunit